jgi:hypothetical protein
MALASTPRYDPISLALAACSIWSLEITGSTHHHSGTKCNFAGFPLPGQTGTFDVWFANGLIDKFMTNTTTIATGMISPGR